MDSITSDFGEVLLWSFWFFIWFGAIMVWFRCLFDMFGDTTLSGWAKAGWAIVLVFLPWLGALIYLIARGRSMQDRQAAAVQKQMDEQASYIRSVSGTQAAPDQIASAKALLDAGTIDEREFAALKAKALA
ncbi:MULTISPECIES: PLDc N-terminal domain-containing protein [Nocardioides]|jgi:hypothetical protein|uniref:PLDc N-terminal domain-containing protein n=1 Tax=Nocardioides TaxID=1839 RepID=UPI000703AA18|nr:MULTISPECIES: PLDc N-terminal domain-containing protein [Nocardioides]KRE99084.1 hypothetical protein ASG88_15225 [Nocardioides sp. Soil777]